MRWAVGVNLQTARGDSVHSIYGSFWEIRFGGKQEGHGFGFGEKQMDEND